MSIPIDIKSGNLTNPDEVIVGIDLGTTNSLIAYMSNGQATTIKDRFGENTLEPSIVHFAEDGTIITGIEAKSQLITKPTTTIYSVKRLMGKSYEDVRDFEYVLGYKIINEDDDSLVKIKLGEKFYTPIELSAEILKSLKFRAQNQLSQTISKAVITVPAYFNDAQRQATRDAGKLAGLDVLRIVNEPTAASLAYGIGLDKSVLKCVAVYDLGGGTFDISILQIENGIFEVLSTNGNTFLGGDDFDKAIMKYWMDQAQIDPSILEENKSLGQALRLGAEEAKKQLSEKESYSTIINSYALSLDRSQFNKLIASLVAKTIQCCKQALSDAGKQTDQIDEVIMVGGSTRVPLVFEKVRQLFGDILNAEIDPDEVVALGAAIQADILAGNQKDLLLRDVTPLSLGIETVGSLMDTLIPRNTKLPVSLARQYTTSVDGQKNLRISVYQGERELVHDNRKLGEFILKDLPPMPAGFPKIEIRFMINADGILFVRAKELRSNKETEMEIRSAYSISEEEMAKMLIESIKNAEEDIQKRAIIEAKNEANLLLKAADKFKNQNIGLFDEKTLVVFDRMLKNVKHKIDSGDKDEIYLAMDEFNEFSKPFAEKSMETTIQKALKGTKV